MAEIRLLQAENMLTVQQLAHQIWPETYSHILSEEQLSYMLNWMYSLESLQQQLKEGHVYYGIFHESEMVGFLDIQEINETELKINKIYVLPNLQGKGLGYKLMQHAINEARNKQMKCISLQVNRFNKAQDFYFKTGFVIREEKDFDIGNGFFMNDYVMELSLGSADHGVAAKLKSQKCVRFEIRCLKMYMNTLKNSLKEDDVLLARQIK